jgi:hypothetical protein
LLAAAFEMAGTPAPCHGLLLACAAGQLGARLVPLPGGLGGAEGGVLGALALTGTRPATTLTAVIVYRVAGFWAPGAAGAITAALLTRRRPRGSRSAHARPHPPRRPRGRSCLPPGPQKVTAMSAHPGKHAPAAWAAGRAASRPVPVPARAAPAPGGTTGGWRRSRC